MEEQQDRCPHCGSDDLKRYKQAGYGHVYPMKGILRIGGQTLIHLICRRCGTVVRSYVEHPETLE